MIRLSDVFSPQIRLWQQEREIAQLREQVATLRAQNDSMREGMRRCVTCDYRIDFKRRQDALVDTPPATHAVDTGTEN
jgi:uncharacterized protein with PIN domain